MALYLSQIQRYLLFSPRFLSSQLNSRISISTQTCLSMQISNSSCASRSPPAVQLAAAFSPSNKILSPVGGTKFLSPYLVSYRHKSRKRSGDEQDEDSDNDDDIELESGTGYKDVKCTVPSLRIGAFAKVGFNISRSQSEKVFYANKLRLNGKKIIKKSQSISVGDQLDYIKNRHSSEGSGLVEVARVELLHVGGLDDGGGTDYTVVVRRYHKLLVKDSDLE